MLLSLLYISPVRKLSEARNHLRLQVRTNTIGFDNILMPNIATTLVCTRTPGEVRNVTGLDACTNQLEVRLAAHG